MREKEKGIKVDKEENDENEIGDGYHTGCREDNDDSKDRMLCCQKKKQP